MEEKRLKAIEEELAYLRKIIEEFVKDQKVEMHYHYTFDYSKIESILNPNEDDNPELPYM